MKELVVPQSDFRFDEFVAKTYEFLEDVLFPDIHPSYAVVSVEAPGDAPTFGPEEGRNTLMQELQQGLLLFFPFSSCNVGEPVPCADGESRLIDDDDDDDDALFIGEVDSVGFLIGLKDGAFVINSAIHGGGCCMTGGSVSCKHCGLMDEPMDVYVRKFVRSPSAQVQQ